MNSLRFGIVIVALAGVFGFGASARAEVKTIDSNTHAAIAFSKSTGKYGYAYNYGSRYSAEQAALSRCKESDAKIVGWVKYGWLVLFVGDNNSHGVAWEWGDGADRKVAYDRAKANCEKHTKKFKAIVILCSGDVDPITIEYK